MEQSMTHLLEICWLVHGTAQLSTLAQSLLQERVAGHHHHYHYHLEIQSMQLVNAPTHQHQQALMVPHARWCPAFPLHQLLVRKQPGALAALAGKTHQKGV